MKKGVFAAISAGLTAVMLFTACTQRDVIQNDVSTSSDAYASAQDIQSTQADLPDEVTLEAQTQPPLTTIAPEDSQLGITVDGWLKVSAITEVDGVLAVVAENVSDADVEYAVLTVRTKNDTLSFNVSAMLRSMTAVLVCNEQVSAEDDESYTSWQTENRVDFVNSPVMNEDVLEISVTDGSISVKNVSDEDISSDIFIYYKDKVNNTLNGSVTHRVRISSLKSGAKTFINAKNINADSCEIIFSQY